MVKRDLECPNKAQRGSYCEIVPIVLGKADNPIFVGGSTCGDAQRRHLFSAACRLLLLYDQIKSYCARSASSPFPRLSFSGCVSKWGRLVRPCFVHSERLRDLKNAPFLFPNPLFMPWAKLLIMGMN
jgi:hypothetical protein